mmetsp:Transcript_18234/g.35771  ORF Transcript_18234/g.35771 Transcript_18234/m.35771 type:complete len:208 (-) Transcript_18234:353-976(-)
MHRSKRVSLQCLRWALVVAIMPMIRTNNLATPSAEATSFLIDSLCSTQVPYKKAAKAQNAISVTTQPISGALRFVSQLPLPLTVITSTKTTTVRATYGPTVISMQTSIGTIVCHCMVCNCFFTPSAEDKLDAISPHDQADLSERSNATKPSACNDVKMSSTRPPSARESRCLETFLCASCRETIARLVFVVSARSMLTYHAAMALRI